MSAAGSSAAVEAPPAGEAGGAPSLRWFSEHPGKRATERFWLLYTPVWGLVCAAVMVGGLAETWGDLPLMVLGVVLGGVAFVGPLVWRAPEEKGLPVHRTAGFKLGLSVVGFSFFLNYSQTPFFYDVLHMHYGFRTEWNIQNNPVFLYFLTVAYFSTYCALCTGTYRLVRSGLVSAPRPVRLLAVGLVPFAVAALESALNANPFMAKLFCYDDMGLMLTFGTLVYGTSLALALPVWVAIDERPGEEVSLLRVAIWVGAALYATVLFLDFYRHLVAPHLTTVVEGAVGLRDYATSCLEAP